MAKRAAKSGAPKGPRKNRKTAATVPGADGNKPLDHNEKGSRLTPDQERALFNSHRQSWLAHQNKQKVLDEARTKLVANLKNDGFLVAHMTIADDLQTPKGEKKRSEQVKDVLRVARWIGHPMGAQMDLFEQPDRTPSVDRAFDQGKQASMEGALKKPPYSPETEQYRSWMAGFDADQDRLRQGVGKGPTADGEPVKGGTPVPRSEFDQKLKENIAEGDAMAKRESAPAPESEADSTKH